MNTPSRILSILASAILLTSLSIAPASAANPAIKSQLAIPTQNSAPIKSNGYDFTPAETTENTITFDYRIGSDLELKANKHGVVIADQRTGQTSTLPNKVTTSEGIQLIGKWQLDSHQLVFTLKGNKSSAKVATMSSWVDCNIKNIRGGVISGGVGGLIAGGPGGAGLGVVGGALGGALVGLVNC